MNAVFARTALRVSAGGIAWALHFTAIYTATALACARATPGLVPWAIAAATLVAIGACLGLMHAGWKRHDDFEAWLSATLAGMALFAIVLQALPALMVMPCR